MAHKWPNKFQHVSYDFSSTRDRSKSDVEPSLHVFGIFGNPDMSWLAGWLAGCWLAGWLARWKIIRNHGNPQENHGES